MAVRLTPSSKEWMRLLCIMNTTVIVIFTVLLTLFGPQPVKVYRLSTTAEGEVCQPITELDDNVVGQQVDVNIATTPRTNAKPLRKAFSPYGNVFKNAYSDEEMKVQLQLMDVFDAAMKNASISYFMYSGTLIGSWRHHGQIPWDDDVDVAVPIKQSIHIENALVARHPAIILDRTNVIRWKIFSNASSIIPMATYAWPYIDISFYRSNATHVWDIDQPIFSKFCFPVDMIFPLRERPFMGRMFPAPAKTGEVLSRTYDLSVCLIGSWNHRLEQERAAREQHKVPCKDLEGVHPFVKRTRIENRGCNETLFHNSKVISWYWNEYDDC